MEPGTPMDLPGIHSGALDWRSWIAATGWNGSAGALQQHACDGSNFADGRLADYQFGSWANFRTAPKRLRQQLFRSTLVDNVDLEIFRVVNGSLSVKNCHVDSGCLRGLNGGRLYLPLLQFILDTARHAGVRLPDVRIMFFSTDGVGSVGQTHPIATASKVQGSKFLLFPNWEHAEKLLKARDRNAWVATSAWEERAPVAVFRGGLTGHDFGPAGFVPLQQIRVSVVRQGALYPDLIDAACDWNSPGLPARGFTPEMRANILDKYCKNGTFLSMQDAANRYRFQVSTDGFGAAFRTFAVLSSGAVPMLPRDGAFSEHYYPLLKPWVHYVPTESFRLHEAVSFLRLHDGLARRIAKAALAFSLSNLTLKGTFCYVLQIWMRLAELQEGLDWEAIELEFAAEMQDRRWPPMANATADTGGADARAFVPYSVWKQIMKE
ncbi:hypothetical protein DFJ74DRAFT_708542 [Hyaloraphidium curvatum]|nr:hypothetical protein DFJ74DRAFT_708542 [Hyaloraphidium curvatum]